jgi:hypothetical protein
VFVFEHGWSPTTSMQGFAHHEMSNEIPLASILVYILPTFRGLLTFVSTFIVVDHFSQVPKGSLT